MESRYQYKIEVAYLNIFFLEMKTAIILWSWTIVFIVLANGIKDVKGEGGGEGSKFTARNMGPHGTMHRPWHRSGSWDQMLWWQSP